MWWLWVDCMSAVKAKTEKNAFVQSGEAKYSIKMIKNTNTTADTLGQDDVLMMGVALGGQELHSLSDFVAVLEQYPPNLNDRVLMIKDFLAKVFDIRKLPTDEYERFQRLGMKESYTVSSTEINGDYINNQIVNNNVYGER